MAIKDDILKESRKLKDMTFKQKSEYIWEYYKIQILVCICVIVGIVFTVTELKNNSKPVFLDAVLINSDTAYFSPDTIQDDFVQYAGINLDTYNISIDDSMVINVNGTDEISIANLEKLLALYASGTTDVVIGTTDVLDRYGELGAHKNLETILSKKCLNTLSDNGYEFYYTALKSTSVDNNGNSIEEKGEPFIAGIYLDNSDYLSKLGGYGAYSSQLKSGKRVIFTIAETAVNIDNAVMFLNMITGVE